MKKKICAFLIVMCLLTVNVNNVYASSGQIVVGGSAVAVGGLGAVGLAGLSGPVVIAVFCGLMAFGFNVELTKQSQAAGMTKTAFVKSKIEEYCQEANKTMDVFCNAILSGMEILDDGRIALSNQACKQIKQFGNWLVDTNQVKTPTSAGDGSTVNLGDLNLPYSGSFYAYRSNNNLLMSIEVQDGKNAACYIYQNLNNGRCNMYMISNEPFNFTSKGSPFGVRAANYYNGYYYTTGVSNIVYSDVGVFNPATPISNVDIQPFLLSLDGSFDISTDAPAEDSFTGDKDDWAAGNNALDPTADKTTTIDPGLLGQLSLPQDTSIEWDWQKYLDAIKDILDRAKDDTSDTTSEGTDTATDTPIPITIDPAITIDPTIAKDDDSSLPPKQDRTPVIDKDDPVSDPDLAVEPLKFDLRNIFPFCIPWDFKDLLSKLNADPVAPSYHVHWKVPFVNEYIDFTVDLSGWNDTAAILRKMELFAFCVGLVLATRQMFIRS